MSDQDSSWQHADDAFESMSTQVPSVDAVAGPANDAPSNPPELHHRVAVGPGDAEVPDAFMQQCQLLWRQAMNIAGEAYQRMKADLTHRIEDLTSERDALQTERDAIRSEFEDFRQSTSSQAEHLSQYETQLAEAKSELTVVQEQEKRQARELADRDRQLEEVLQAVGANETRAQEAESLLAKERGLRQDLEAQLKEASVNALAGNDSEELQQALNNTSSKLDVVTKERDRIDRDLNEAFETINFSMERARQLEQELVEARAAIAKEKGRVEEAKAHAADIEGEAAVLRRKNEMVNREAQAFAEKNAELLRRLHEAAAAVK